MDLFQVLYFPQQNDNFILDKNNQNNNLNNKKFGRKMRKKNATKVDIKQKELEFAWDLNEENFEAAKQISCSFHSFNDFIDEITKTKRKYKSKKNKKNVDKNNNNDKINIDNQNNYLKQILNNDKNNKNNNKNNNNNEINFLIGEKRKNEQMTNEQTKRKKMENFPSQTFIVDFQDETKKVCESKLYHMKIENLINN